MKHCPGCERDLPDDSFSWKKLDVRRSSRCRECQKRYKDGHYRANKSVYVAKAKKWVQDYKSEHPCTDCGGFFHFCQMDFDHLRDKSINVNLIASRGGRLRLIEEMAKRELVCSNCHRLRTYRRRHGADNPCGREPAFNPVKVGSTPTSAARPGPRTKEEPMKGFT